jgi:hypothetical protein
MEYIFGYFAAKFTCPHEDFYKDEKIRNGLTRLFGCPMLKTYQVPEQRGHVVTTCNLPNLSLSTLNIQHLIDWIEERILECSSFLWNRQASKVIITMMWANQMLLGSEGICHTHKRNIDGVAIFYQSVPEHSGDLAFIRNGLQGTSYNNYMDNDCKFQNIKSGDLIVHHKSLPHAISTHMSTDPRISFIFEFKYC